MKARITISMVAALLASVSEMGFAGPVGPLVTFTSGTQAKASEVNGNFNAVRTAVNDNSLRIGTLEINAASPNITGNITLVPSTPAAGNILKGADPFIHNSGGDNTFVGVNAGNLAVTGMRNTGSGRLSLQSVTSGQDNTATGWRALVSNTDGSSNTASGTQALENNTSGFNNTAIGVEALRFNTTGANNTGCGVNTLIFNETGSSNTAIGWGALQDNVSGQRNTALGQQALLTNVAGSNNIAIGSGAGSNLTGSFNIALASLGFAGESNTMRLGGGNQTRAFIAGVRGVTTANADALNVVIDSTGQLGTISSSRRVKDDIADMGVASAALMALRPVTFRYKSDSSRERTLQYGLVAEEVAEVAPGLVARSADGEIETVYYHFLAPMLVNEYQKQHRMIEAQAAEIAGLRREMARMAKLIAER